MKRTMVWLLGVMMALASSLALADATAVSVSGSVSAQVGVSGARTVRQGDTLRAGDIVSTSGNSSAVLRFPDGQIAALGPNSRMVIEAYQYDSRSQSGNVVLNLITGGMRAISGLIGRNSPSRVAYKAGNYTIGIRGTDVTIATTGGNVAVTVADGAAVFTIGGQTYTVTVGNAALINANGTVRTDVIAAIVQQVQNTSATLLESLQGTNSVPITITVPPPGPGATAPGETITGTVSATPAPSGAPGGAGGGPGSRR